MGGVLRCPTCLNKKLYHSKAQQLYICQNCGNKTEQPKDTGIIKKPSKKRNLRDDQFWSRQKVLRILSLNLKDIIAPKIRYRDCALVALLFLTGARISELVGTKNRDIKGAYKVEPLRRHQIEIGTQAGIKIIMIRDIPILKKKLKERQTLAGDYVSGYPLRTVKLPYDAEKDFIWYIEKYLDMIPNDPDYILFPIGKGRALQIMYRYFGRTFNHFWRHCRATDVSSYYGFSQIATKLFFKWSSTQQAERYTHITEDELLKLAHKNTSDAAAQ